jgi:hypothetical protein
MDHTLTRRALLTATALSTITLASRGLTIGETTSPSS